MTLNRTNDERFQSKLEFNSITIKSIDCLINHQIIEKDIDCNAQNQSPHRF